MIKTSFYNVIARSIRMTIKIQSYHFGHDINGNPTSLFTVWLNGDIIKTTSRRSQCGYDDKRIQHALHWLQSGRFPLHTYQYKCMGIDGSRSEGMIEVSYEILEK